MPFDVKAGFTWVKAHPWETGGIVFLIGVGAFFLLSNKGGSSSSASGPDANLSSYLAAETAQNQNDDALSALMSTNSAATTQAGIGAAAQTDIANTWAAESVVNTANDNATTTQTGLIAALGQLANNLGITLTNTTSKSSQSGSGGSFGLGIPGIIGFNFGNNSSGASSSASSTQTFVANNEQSAAEAELEQIANTQFHIGN